MTEMPWERWVVADSRTQRALGVACYRSEAQALAQIAGWVARDAKGGRPDCHHLIPFMVAIRDDIRDDK